MGDKIGFKNLIFSVISRWYLRGFMYGIVLDGKEMISIGQLFDVVLKYFIFLSKHFFKTHVGIIWR